MLYYLCMNSPDNNLNNSYYETLDENFNHALNLFEKDLSQEEILNYLTKGNILQKQISALKITHLKNESDTLTLIQNLVGQDGKIRESVSLKTLELIKNPTYADYFNNKKIYDIFLEAIIDINSNVCRNIISSIKYVKNNELFQTYFIPQFLENTQKLIDKVKDFDFQDGKYKVNKEVFKLYWYLETLYELTDLIPSETIKKILLQTKNIAEYTIREKTAKILTLETFNDNEFNQIRNELKNDKNYYVRRF